MTKKEKRIEDIEKFGNKGKGKSEYIKYLSNGDLSGQQAIRAKCYDCMGWYADGTRCCEEEACALFPFMPYNENKRKSKNVSEEFKKKASERFKNMRKEKADKI